MGEVPGCDEAELLAQDKLHILKNLGRAPLLAGATFGLLVFETPTRASAMNLVDVLIPVALLAGLIRGRKHGISVELIRTLKWIALVITGAAFAPQAADFLSRHSFFGYFSACLTMYLGIVVAVFVFFSMLERRLTRRLEKGDAFGHAEYYLGMAAGMVRAACMILMALSLLNYRSFTTTQVHAMEKFQRDEYGSEVFPTLFTFQKSVFQDSLMGKWIKNNLSFLMLNPSPNPPRGGKA